MNIHHPYILSLQMIPLRQLSTSSKGRMKKTVCFPFFDKNINLGLLYCINSLYSPFHTPIGSGDEHSPPIYIVIANDTKIRHLSSPIREKKWNSAFFAFIWLPPPCISMGVKGALSKSCDNLIEWMKSWYIHINWPFEPVIP